jgi:hypothetical protein
MATLLLSALFALLLAGLIGIVLKLTDSSKRGRKP